MRDNFDPVTMVPEDDEETIFALERFVVCVNACKGISSEALEAGIIKDLLATCKAAKEALQSLQMDALGFAVSNDGRFAWPIRDELINDLTAVITAARPAVEPVAKEEMSMDSHVKFWNDLQQSIINTEELKRKSGADLADLLLHYEWSELDQFTPESDLMAEVIRRLAVYDVLRDTCEAAAKSLGEHGSIEFGGEGELASQLAAAIAAARPAAEPVTEHERR